MHFVVHVAKTVFCLFQNTAYQKTVTRMCGPWSYVVKYIEIMDA